MLRQEATALMERLKVSVAGHVLLTPFHPDTIKATIFVYNGFEGESAAHHAYTPQNAPMKTTAR